MERRPEAEVERPSEPLPVLGSDLETGVSVHVFTVSAAMVGVCLTVIGIVRISMNMRSGYETVADEILAADSAAFTAACLLAYASLRSVDRARAKWFERIADRLFLGGMVAMCGTCALIAASLV